MDKTESKQTCAHQGCHCKVDPVKGVKFEGKVFCSADCAQGIGCKHEHCHCGG